MLLGGGGILHTGPQPSPNKVLETDKLDKWIKKADELRESWGKKKWQTMPGADSEEIDDGKDQIKEQFGGTSSSAFGHLAKITMDKQSSF